MKATCGNCKRVLVECKAECLFEDIICHHCSAINQFDNSSTPSRVILPRTIPAKSSPARV